MWPRKGAPPARPHFLSPLPSRYLEIFIFSEGVSSLLIFPVPPRKFDIPQGVCCVLCVVCLVVFLWACFSCRGSISSPLS